MFLHTVSCLNEKKTKLLTLLLICGYFRMLAFREMEACGNEEGKIDG